MRTLFWDIVTLSTLQTDASTSQRCVFIANLTQGNSTRVAKAAKPTCTPCTLQRKPSDGSGLRSFDTCVRTCPAGSRGPVPRQRSRHLALRLHMTVLTSQLLHLYLPLPQHRPRHLSIVPPPRPPPRRQHHGQTLEWQYVREALAVEASWGELCGGTMTLAIRESHSRSRTPSAVRPSQRRACVVWTTMNYLCAVYCCITLMNSALRPVAVSTSRHRWVVIRAAEQSRQLLLQTKSEGTGVSRPAASV